MNSKGEYGVAKRWFVKRVDAIADIPLHQRMSCIGCGKVVDRNWMQPWLKKVVGDRCALCARDDLKD